VSFTTLAPLITLVCGVAIGYFAWGTPSGNGAARDLAVATEQLRAHEEMLARVSADGGALAECEAVQARMAEKLEACLFDQHRPTAPGPDAAAPAQPRSGVSKFSETIEYPVPIEPKEPKKP
jgi:hypothetical protein